MSYTSNLTVEQYQKIALLLPVVKTTRPRKYSYHEIMNGILYVLVTWCQWRNLPKDLPPWETCYHYYYVWKNEWVFDKIFSELHKELRKKNVKGITTKSGYYWLTSSQEYR